MYAIITFDGNIINAKFAKKVSKKSDSIISRTEIMQKLLDNNIDKKKRDKLSFIYELIIDLETEKKTYIDNIKILESENV